MLTLPPSVGVVAEPGVVLEEAMEGCSGSLQIAALRQPQPAVSSLGRLAGAAEYVRVCIYIHTRR